MSVGSVTSVFYTFPFPSFKRMYLKRQRVVFQNQANGNDKQNSCTIHYERLSVCCYKAGVLKYLSRTEMTVD